MDQPRRLPPRRSGEARISGAAPTPEPRTAALMQRASIPAKAKLLSSSSGRRGKSWEDEVMDFDRNGPGLLGYYLDMVGLMASMVPLVPEELNSQGKWERSDDQVLHVIASAWRGNLPQITQAELLFKAVRLREAIGRCWHIADPNLGWCVVAKATPQNDVDKSVAWTTMYGTPRVTTGDRVYYSWVGDTYDDHLSTSSVRRALSDLRRIRAAVRSQTRSANSRLLTNGLLAFPSGDETARPMAAPEGEDGEETELTGVDKLLDDFVDLAKLGFSDDDSAAANIPFPYIGPKAEFVSLGGDIDPTALDSERMGIAGFARSVNFPQKLIEEGPGDANHWNEYLLKEEQVKMGLAPKVDPVVADVTAMHFRPVIAMLSRQMNGWVKNPKRCRLVADYDYLLERPVQASELLSAWQAGVASRQSVADAYRIADKLDIPNGMSEFEFWQLQARISGAPYAETDLTGNLIIPPPPMDPTAGGFSLGGTAAEGAPPPALPPAPPAPAGPGGEPSTVNPVTEPPAPPTVTAAMSSQDNPNDIQDWAEREDQRLQATLAALAAVIVAATTAEIAKQTILAAPARSAERAMLRELPDDKVWGAATAETRQGVDPAAVAATVAAKYQRQIEAAFAESQESFARKWGPTIAAVLTASMIASGASALIAALVPWIMFQFDRNKLTVTKVPADLVVGAMTAAGGARSNADGTVAVSAGNTPMPETGGEWIGNTGFITGNAVAEHMARKYGRPVEWQWIHGFYGEPETPFPPHVDLHRKRFPSPSDVPNGMYPLDHRGCRCGWRLRWAD